MDKIDKLVMDVSEVKTLITKYQEDMVEMKKEQLLHTKSIAKMEPLIDGVRGLLWKAAGVSIAAFTLLDYIPK